MPLADGWRERSGRPSLSEVFRSVAVPVGVTPFRRFLAFVGPGYLVAVGYMDPGNWATSLAGGAAFGYQLLFIALLSNVMAILLQSLCARLAGPEAARTSQLVAEYAPAPPFAAGTPETAGPAITARARAILGPLIDGADAAAAAITRP